MEIKAVTTHETIDAISSHNYLAGFSNAVPLRGFTVVTMEVVLVVVLVEEDAIL